MRSTILAICLLLGAVVGTAQMKFFEETFQGGVVTGGWSNGIASSGSGSFTVNIPPGSTIRRAYLIGGRVGPTPATTLNLNGTNFVFDTPNEVSAGFTSLYGGASAVHVIDVTASINPATTNYTMTCNGQSSVSNKFPEFYLWIAFDNTSLPVVTAAIYLNNITFTSPMVWNLSTVVPIQTTSPVGVAVLGGYAANTASDCEQMDINGTYIGDWAAMDFNASSGYGAMSAFQYYNNVLTGYGDDNANQAINGPEALSNAAALIPNNSLSFPITFTHCPGGSTTDNHVWAVFLTYSGGTVLATDLYEFSARPNEDGTIHTWWEVGQEDALQAYTVERSGNGTAFEELGNLAPEGKSNYSLADKNPLLGSNWYRLRMTDQNGRYQYSKQVEIVLGPESGISLEFFPNPVQAGGKLHFNLANEEALNLDLMDAAGKLVRELNYPPSTGSSLQKDIDLNGLAPGLYLVRGRISGGDISGKFVVE
ncbi:MAG: T9SS type A sorting domain-containing protein [Bacteroidia bacterium]|nr:T9SS type A sorting domain-containing protein [Bacteroidia bacterium]